LVVVEVSPPAEEECSEEVDTWDDAEDDGGPEDEWLN